MRVFLQKMPCVLKLSPLRTLLLKAFSKDWHCGRWQSELPETLVSNNCKSQIEKLPKGQKKKILKV